MKILKIIKIGSRVSEVFCIFCKKTTNPHYTRANYLVRIQLFKGFAVWVYFCEKCYKLFMSMLKAAKRK